MNRSRLVPLETLSRLRSQAQLMVRLGAGGHSRMERLLREHAFLLDAVVDALVDEDEELPTIEIDDYQENDSR